MQVHVVHFEKVSQASVPIRNFKHIFCLKITKLELEPELGMEENGTFLSLESQQMSHVAWFEV